MKKVKIGIAGLGVVGQGVYKILQEESKNLSKKSDCEFEIVAVASRSQKSFVDPKIKFYSDILKLATDPEIEIVVELIGGEKIAKELVCLALKNNKKVVTANKALLATYGKEIADLCENFQTKIGFEASVAASNPVIKAYLESFVANKIDKFFGILNGTCNFVLSKMEQEKQDYNQVLLEAQKLGFAEADPTLDVGGFDAAHKCAILATIASGSILNFSEIFVEGIQKISITDIELAKQLGYVIKLLAVFKNSDFNNFASEHVFAAVYPAMISTKEKIAQIDGSYNCLLTYGSNFEWNMMIGRGAGSRPTASAVVADIVELAARQEKSSQNSNLFGFSAQNQRQISCIKIDSRFGRYCLRFDFASTSLSEQNSVGQNLISQLAQVGIRISSTSFLHQSFQGNESKNQNDSQNSFQNKSGGFISCALLTENHHETKILKALESLDKSLFFTSKFIRLEETNF